MRKKLLAWLLVVCMLLPMMPTALAADIVDSGTCGENLTWTLDGDGVLTISGTGAMDDYTSSSNTPWYSNRSSVKTVIISDGVTTIGDYAFCNCSSLTSVTIPDSVVSIGDGAFAGCNSLTDITIPGSVTSIGDEAFSYCYSLISVTILDGVTSIGDEAFSGCSSLTSITIPDSVTSIGKTAFWGCYSLISVTILDGVTSIGDSAFCACESLTNITIPDSVTSIGDRAFCGCNSLTSITIPDSVTSIGSWTFYSCSNLTSITIPDSVTSIGYYAFEDCSSLTDVYYSGSQEDWAQITIDEDNTCLTDATIHFNWNPEPDFDSGTCGENLTWTLDGDGVLTISGTGEMYNYSDTSDVPMVLESPDTPWYSNCSSVKTVIIESGVTSIGNYAFYNCGLTSVTIPDSVTSIGDNAFAWCSLPSITIPDSVTTIGDSAFNQCNNLTSVTIGSGVTTIGDYAFWQCNSLPSITIPNSATSIGDGAFGWCGLTSIIIPDSITTIGDNAFWQCNSLTSITILNSVTTIGDCAFYNCSSLTSITIPDSVTAIGYKAFEGCDSLTDVYYSGSQEDWAQIIIDDGNTCLTDATIHFNWNPEPDIDSGTCGENLTWTLNGDGVLTISGTGEIPGWEEVKSANVSSMADVNPWKDYASQITKIVIGDGITKIGELAFSGYSEDTVELPDSITELGPTAFGWSEELSKINLPESLTAIPENLFAGCSNLQKIGIPESVSSIGKQAFYQCRGLTEITIPGSGVTVDHEAFANCVSLKDVYCGGFVSFTRANSEANRPNGCTFAQDTVTIHYPAGDADCETYVQQNSLKHQVICDNCNITWKFDYAGEDKSGTCGENLTWTLDGDGVLTISGTGEMYNYSDTSDLPFLVSPDTPWYSNCGSVKTVIIESGVTSIGNYAFYNCALTSVTIPDSVAIIGNWTFNSCSNLTSITIPDSVTTIGDLAFQDCSSLTSVTIPNSVTSIGAAAFQFCSSLTSIIIPDSVAIIGNWTFYSCSNLTSITIPDSVTAIGYNAFGGCDSLTDVYYSGSQEGWEQIFIDSFNTCLTDATIHCDKNPDPEPQPPTNPFTDVKSGSPYYEAILWAVANNITKGTSSTTFSPGQGCTRGQVVTFLWRAAGEPEPTSTVNPFKDVKSSSSFYKAILWAVEQGITLGYDDGTFRPNATCTRGQVATFLWRAAGKPQLTSTKNPFKDVKTSSHYYEGILWAVEQGITLGYDDGTFRPNATCTRAHVVTFLYRANA